MSKMPITSSRKSVGKKPAAARATKPAAKAQVVKAVRAARPAGKAARPKAAAAGKKPAASKAARAAATRAPKRAQARVPARSTAKSKTSIAAVSPKAPAPKTAPAKPAGTAEVARPRGPGTEAVKASALRVARVANPPAAKPAAAPSAESAMKPVAVKAAAPVSAAPPARSAARKPATPTTAAPPARSAARKPATPTTAAPPVTSAARKPGKPTTAAPPAKALPRKPAAPIAAAAPVKPAAEPPADPVPAATPAPRDEASKDATPPVAEAPAAAVPAVEAPAPKKRLAPRPKLEAWEPRVLPAPRLGKPEDPRLAAAIAARERWHGRSGRPALKSATQAVAFARERRLVQLAEPTALPNLLDPIVGKACVPAERFEGPTATTFRGWSKEVHAAHDLLELRIAFERPTLVQAELWPSIVAVATPREEAARDGSLALPREAEEALEILDRKGTVPVERLRSLLGLGPKEMAHLQGQLEAQLLVLARGDVDDDGPITILEPFGRWAARAVGPRRLELHQAFTVLFAAAMRSAVVLWPDEIATLFPWTPAERDAAVAACVQAGAVVTYDEGGSVAYVASPVPR